MVCQTRIDGLILVVTSIYSVDFHPTEPMIATAGGGEQFTRPFIILDSNVLLWSTEPIFSKEKEDDENTPRLLSVLRGHSDVTSCCRFSRDGRLGFGSSLILVVSLLVPRTMKPFESGGKRSSL